MAELLKHHFYRLRFYRCFLLVCSMILLLSACSPAQSALRVPLTLSAAATDTIVPTSPIAPTNTVTPVPTDTQSPTATSFPASVCFATYYDPVAFLPDGKQLLVRAADGVQIFDLQAMREIGFIKASGNLNGPVVALSPDGERLAWAFDDGTIQILRIADQTVLASFSSEQTPFIKLEYSPVGDQLYSVSHDGSVKTWDADGNLVNTLLPGFEIVNIGLSYDGKLLATIPSDGPVSLWNAADSTWISDLGGTGGYDTSDAVFSPDGKYLAADLVSGLFVWNITDNLEMRGAISPTNSMSVAYSPDGRYLAYADLNNIVLSSPDSLNIVRTLAGHLSPVFELVFSPDSSLLVSADDREIRVWQVDDGQLLAIGKSSCP